MRSMFQTIRAFLSQQFSIRCFLFICTNCYQPKSRWSISKAYHIDLSVQDSNIEDPFELEETLFEPKNTDIKDLFEELYPRPSTTHSHHYGRLCPLPGQSINALSDTILHDEIGLRNTLNRNSSLGEQFYRE